MTFDLLTQKVDRFMPVALGPLGIKIRFQNIVFTSSVTDGRTDRRTDRWKTLSTPQPTQAPPRCTKCNSPPINGQCTNFVLFAVAI